MKKIGTLALAALLYGGSGCVPLSEYQALERRFAQQESYVNNNKNKLREMERREQSLTLRSSEQEKQLDLYRARLEKSERLRQRLEGQLDESQTALSLAASAPREEPTPTLLPTEVMGLQVNPATQGLILETGVMFPAGQATLSTKGKQILDRVRTELSAPQYSAKRIRIDGHTDDNPIKRSGHQSNWDLSSKRALAVLHYLEQGGVSSDRLSFGGYGPFMPLVSGSTKEAKAKNRRVEIVLLD
ncbi:MAG: OmpA family protein [Planctomycetes bacterium]|nr:OmpA family protein [Planctomycetota bacterium]